MPLVEYEQVERYLELIGRQDDLNDVVVAVFPPEPDKPCIHIPVNPSIPSHWGAVERELTSNALSGHFWEALRSGPLGVCVGCAFWLVCVSAVCARVVVCSLCVWFARVCPVLG